ncbi:hypothetical protein FA13DRAFT_1619949 [Coprinellus micaceus]|uniref:CxC1-like cysteine cluster associated with KDZ transposases domain-containing protein n=1 Tax=Coprinellus micaceus TaxID=71717 RepID=A0A4Y7TY14_COPMI|nr:hypothetical protein FA13DRAFT_1619949 [Coprinellus micaceus]
MLRLSIQSTLILPLGDGVLTLCRYSRRYYQDGRTWRNRRTRFDTTWNDHHEAMTDAYLRWRYPRPQTDDTMEQDTPADNDLDLAIVAVDLYTLQREAVVPWRNEEVSAVSLVKAGYMGNSPISPSIAISLKTLELFKVLRQRKPSFSFEAFTKVLCDLYQQPYHRQWRIALADTFDIFLKIKHSVDERVAESLGRSTPNWRVLNSCPPCTYELEGEPNLNYRILCCIDGNSSTKRVDTGFRQQGDTRKFSSDFFLEVEEVDKLTLKDIRVSESESKGPEVPLFDDEQEREDEPEDEPAQPVRSGKPSEISDCVRNWKAAQSDSKKRTLEMFNETGWFASGCRHGLTLWVADMVRTGEQAKYPLAIIDRALNVLGPKLLIGYDIGCVFEGTIKSTILGPRFIEMCCRTIVGAYHGFAHNWACQIRYHPNNFKGAGIEDFEGQERLFSAPNATALVIRYASKYRRRLFLDLFLTQYDKDKYANLGLVLRNNYQQALKIIEQGSRVLEDFLRDLKVTRSDLDAWQIEQGEYFSTLGKEPEEDIHKIAYVELLQELESAKTAASSKTANFLNIVPEDWGASQQTYTSNMSKTRKAEMLRKNTRLRVTNLEKEAVEMELKLGVTSRWDSTVPEYVETVKYMVNRQYHRALDDLQRLVVQRLFELHRLGLSRIGYRARTLLAKALRTRSKAIQNAANRYNEATRQLDPPGPHLDWTQIAKYNFVEEFSLLRSARRDIRPERWSDGEVREAMKLHQRIERAREEIVRLNVEVRQLYTAIHDEHILFAKVRLELERAGQYELLGALTDLVTERKGVNMSILRYLEDIKGLHGYSGSKDLLGLRQGATARDEGAGPM